MKQQLSVFLSHSHKDVSIVRKIRDILEMFNCDPIMFYLKCLDDDNDELESFIKKEIDARNIFIYCKSNNSENSKWVQKELDYIKSTNSNRLYTIDIEEKFENNLLSILSQLSILIRYNCIMMIYMDSDDSDADRISNELTSIGYRVTKERFVIPRSMKKTPLEEYVYMHDSFAIYVENTLVPTIKKLSEQGTVLILNNRMNDGDWGAYMIGKINNWFLRNPVYKMLSINSHSTVNEINEKLAELYKNMI